MKELIDFLFANYRFINFTFAGLLLAGGVVVFRISKEWIALFGAILLTLAGVLSIGGGIDLIVYLVGNLLLTAFFARTYVVQRKTSHLLTGLFYLIVVITNTVLAIAVAIALNALGNH